VTPPIYQIAVVGGTGALGRGLSSRLVQAGHRVAIGSREEQRAVDAAGEIADAVSNASVSGATNVDAAGQSDIVIMAVPYSSHDSTLRDLQPILDGKILVDCTVPLVPPKVSRVQLPPEGSAAKAAQDLLGDGVRVVSAFQNVAAAHLENLDHSIDGDVLVCGNDPDARQVVIDLAKEMGMVAWHAGRIENSAATEALTSTLIFMNRHYKVPGAGIRMTGIEVDSIR
jgi:NADPH-dependent F420 reductase